MATLPFAIITVYKNGALLKIMMKYVSHSYNYQSPAKLKN